MQIERDDLQDKVRELEIALASLKDRKTPLANRHKTENSKATLQYEDPRVIYKEIYNIFKGKIARFPKIICCQER